MPIDVLVNLVVAAATPALLERLKDRPWAPFVARHSRRLNRATAVATAILTAVGVSWTFDQEIGRLTIDGLLWPNMLDLGLRAAASFAVQELSYRQVVDRGRG